MQNRRDLFGIEVKKLLLPRPDLSHRDLVVTRIDVSPHNLEMSIRSRMSSAFRHRGLSSTSVIGFENTICEPVAHYLSGLHVLRQ
jgi:hypothetical protein